MSYAEKDELESFLDVFLVNGGSNMAKSVAAEFLNDLHSPDVSEQDMRDRYSPSTYTLVVDALNTWSAARRYERVVRTNEVKDIKEENKILRETVRILSELSWRGSKDVGL